MALHEGDPAPGIDLETDAGERFSLATLKGKNVVLYFYPKADTPGCTTESCEFRDASPQFGQDTVVIRISPDPPNAQAKFKGKYSLPFPLLCDTEHSVAEAYGVWAEKSMYGKKDGLIKKIWRKVKPAGHAAVE